MVGLIKYKTITFIIILVIFVALGMMVKGSTEGILFDNQMLEYIHNNINPLLLRIMKIVSFIGSAYFIIPLMAIVLVYNYIRKKAFESKILLMSTAGSWILNFLLKQVFQRTRPLQYFLVEQGGYSYPSGHTMVATSFYFAIAYIITRNIKDRRIKAICFIIATVAILVMGSSRLYLGVHWPTDIIGGFLMGYILFQISVTLIKQEE